MTIEKHFAEMWLIGTKLPEIWEEFAKESFDPNNDEHIYFIREARKAMGIGRMSLKTIRRYWQLAQKVKPFQ